jgi:hypothetical protein
MTSPPSSTARAFPLGTSFVHYQSSTKKVFSVQGSNRLLRLRVVINFGESESARLAGESVAQQR